MAQTTNRYDLPVIAPCVMISFWTGFGVCFFVWNLLKAHPNLFVLSSLGTYILLTIQSAGALERSYSTQAAHSAWCGLFVLLVGIGALSPISPLIGIALAIGCNTIVEVWLSRQLAHGNTTLGLITGVVLALRGRYPLTESLWNIEVLEVGTPRDIGSICWLIFFFFSAPVFFALELGWQYALVSMLAPVCIGLFSSELFLRFGIYRSLLARVVDNSNRR